MNIQIKRIITWIILENVQSEHGCLENYRYNVLCLWWFKLSEIQSSEKKKQKKNKRKKKPKLQRDVGSEPGGEMCIDTPRSQRHIKAQLQPRPLLQCVEINWVKKICCLRLKWVMGGSVTIVFCLPEAIYRSFWLSLFSALNTCLSLHLHPPSSHHPSTF